MVLDGAHSSYGPEIAAANFRASARRLGSGTKPSSCAAMNVVTHGSSACRRWRGGQPRSWRGARPRVGRRARAQRARQRRGGNHRQPKKVGLVAGVQLQMARGEVGRIKVRARLGQRRQHVAATPPSCCGPVIQKRCSVSSADRGPMRETPSRQVASSCLPSVRIGNRCAVAVGCSPGAVLALGFRRSSDRTAGRQRGDRRDRGEARE